jgi:RNA polymerase sigma factor (sigma-70 family)
VMRAVTDTRPDSRPGPPDSAPARPRPSTDAALIEPSWREPERFAEVFDRHYDPIHGYVARRLGASVADDVASETFLVAFDRRRRYDVGQASARPWLYGIAANLVARHRRAEVRRYRALARADVPAADDGHGEGVARRLDAATLRRRLAAALVEIAHGDREVLLLVAWAQLSCEEAAIFRAMKRLPGVTVLDTVDVLGRRALALGLTTSDWLHEELLLDKETYAYRGERSTIVRDATIDPLKAGNATGQVRKGSTVVVARAATAIVDEPGRRR